MIRRTNALRTLRLKAPLLYMSRSIVLGGARYVSSAQLSPPKSFKPASFVLPKEMPPAAPAAKEEVPPELKDFHMTKIVAGHTDLKIGITEKAKAKLDEIAEQDLNPDSALKITVESGGCHGFQYNLELSNMKDELAKDPELVVFERIDSPTARVMFDESSLEILQDSKIDYTKELIGSSFKVVDSPYTSTSCGCGASFDFDFEKLEQAKGQKQ